MMRTTLDLPDELHRIVTSLALHTQRSLSQTAADLMRRGLFAPMDTQNGKPGWVVNPATGLPLLNTARTITPEDVKAVDDAT